jgi:hypothetical protein
MLVAESRGMMGTPEMRSALWGSVAINFLLANHGLAAADESPITIV